MAEKRKSMGERDNVCRDFVKGFCRFEGKCKFEHPGGNGKASGGTIDPLICKDYARGHCEYGARCRFKHPTPCKDFLAGSCTFPNCRFFHPPGAQGANANGPPMGGKRGHDFDELPPQFCRDFVYNGVCRRPRCSFLHDMPNKRRSGPDGPFPPVGPGGPPGWNDGPQAGPGPVSDPNYVNPELKAYVSQLELKLTMYEEKIKDLEKRCDQYEDLNKLLTERNDELKAKLEAPPRGGYPQGGSGYGGGSGGSYQTSSGGSAYPGGNGAGYQGNSGGGTYPGGSGGSNYPGGSGGSGGGNYQGGSGGGNYPGGGSGGSYHQGGGSSGGGGYHTSSQPGDHASSRSSGSRPKYYSK